MTIDIFTSAGQKKGTLELPQELFGQPVNRGLIHQALMRQQSNRRSPIAHAKNRHEVAGSTRKLYAQKHTGRARRGSIRSPLLRGGGKAFGPRSVANFEKDMPRSMRRAALASCLSFQAKKGIIMGLEGYPTSINTKAAVELLSKMSLKDSRRVLFVLPERHDALWLSTRNLPAVKTILVSYLNPEDILLSRSIVFVGDSIERALKLFGPREVVEEVIEEKEEEKVKKPQTRNKKPSVKNAAAKAKKAASKKSASSSK